MSSPLAIALVEDEAVVARRLERLTRRILGDRVASLVRLSSLPEALHHVRHHPVDVLLLDLNLRGQDGFQVLEEAAAGSFHTLIISARHELALRAFEYGVVDFVPKPYGEARLRQAFERLRGLPSEHRQLKFLAVRKGRRVVPIPLDDVLYLQASGDYSQVICHDGSEHLHQKTLTQLSQLLPEAYVLVHRSYLVDLRQVESLESRPGSRYFLRLRGGQEIPVSRARVHDLRQRLI